MKPHPDAPGSEAYFRQIRSIMDACIVALTLLYEEGERNRRFADACVTINRTMKQLQELRRQARELEGEG